MFVLGVQYNLHKVPEERVNLLHRMSTTPHLPLLSVQKMVGRGFPMRPVPQTRVAVSPSTTATVLDPRPSKLAPTVVSNMLFPDDYTLEKIHSFSV